MHRLGHTVPGLILLLLGSPPLTAQAQPKPHPTCHETAERVLAPFLHRVAAGEAALVAYEDQNARHQQAIRDLIQRLKDTRLTFAKAQKDEAKAFADRIRYAQEAVTEIRTSHREQIQKSRAAAAEGRKQKNERYAVAQEKRARDLEQALAAGTASGYKSELGFTRSIKGWQAYAQEQTVASQKRMADYAAGKVTHYHRALSYSANGQGIQKALKVQAERLAAAGRREVTFYLAPIAYSLNGAGIDKDLAKRRADLQDARARVRAGTFKLYIPTLGYTADRNAVQKLIADAKEKYRQTVANWGAKKYRNYNPLAGATTSNGAIEKQIATARKDLADFLAAGDRAKVYVREAGYTTSGADFKKAAAAARAKGDSAGAARAMALYRAWQKAKAAAVTHKRAGIARLEKRLAKHAEVYKADLAKQKAYIDKNLTWALGETPCGGGPSVEGDPRKRQVDAHRDKLRRMGESPEESQRRVDEYDDKIYVEGDGTVHGDPRDGWQNAVRDTGATDPSRLQKGAEALLELKNIADWLAGHKDVIGGGLDLAKMRAEMKAASSRIDAFIEALGALSKGDANFFALRRKLRVEFFRDIQGLLSKGALSESRIRGLLAALKKTGSGSVQAGMLKKQLRGLLAASRSYNRFGLPRLSRVLADVKTLREGAKASYRAFVNQSLADLRGKISQGAKKMSRFDKGMLALSLAAAAAEVVQNTEQGMPVSEAVGRSGVNLAIDFAIAGFPITAAAEAATQVLFSSYGYYSGDKSWNDATLSGTAKYLAGRVLDGVAGSGQMLGEASIIAERAIWNEPGMSEILANVDFARLRGSLSTVEGRLDALEPGHPDEARLLRMRETFRRLIRAKQQGR